MKSVLDDGRVFETKPFLEINLIPDDPVYKFVFLTDDRKVKSSARHEWVVWNKITKKIEMVRMDAIDIAVHELLIQGWK